MSKERETQFDPPNIFVCVASCMPVAFSRDREKCEAKVAEWRAQYKVAEALDVRCIEFAPILNRKPAPQSESEAVRLLRALFDATQSPTLQIATMRNQEADALYALTCKVEEFLKRPPGPDWRTLAVGALEGWYSGAEIKAFRAIHDAIKSEAAATGNGGK